MLVKNISGCQGVIGPFPSAFLDKWITKNWCKVEDRIWICQIFFRNSSHYHAWPQQRNNPDCYRENFAINNSLLLFYRSNTQNHKICQISLFTVVIILSFLIRLNFSYKYEPSCSTSLFCPFLNKLKTKIKMNILFFGQKRLKAQLE